MRHVHANLVGPSGLKTTLDQGHRAEALTYPVVRNRVATVVAHCLFQAIVQMATDRRIDAATRNHRAIHDRGVLAMHGARRQLFDQRGVRAQRARDHHQARGVLVEPMHNAAARDLGELGIVMQQRVLQRSVRVAGPRMNDQSGWLIDHDHIGVFVADVERDVLCHRADLAFHAHAECDRLAAMDNSARRHCRAIEQRRTGLDPRGQPRARIVREQLGQGLVEAPPGESDGDRCIQAGFRFGHAQVPVNGCVSSNSGVRVMIGVPRAAPTASASRPQHRARSTARRRAIRHRGRFQLLHLPHHRRACHSHASLPSFPFLRAQLRPA